MSLEGTCIYKDFHVNTASSFLMKSILSGLIADL